MAMTPDTRSILTSLRLMKDPELQQYAAMHKNDPFIFPLAFQESQMRKQVRAEAQARQQQPQAKVVDQNLAAMAPQPPMPVMPQQGRAQSMPEDVGIAQLPAKNLEGIATGAAGGIVAFDEGGEVPRFQNTGLVQYPGMLPMEGGTVLPTTSGFEGMSTGEFLSTIGRKAKGALSDYFSKEREKANAQAMYGGPKAPTKADIAALGNVGGFNTAYDPVVSAAVAAANAPDKAGTVGTGGTAPGDNKYSPTYPGSTGMRPGGGLGLAAIPGLTTTATGTAQELQAMRDQFGQPTVPQSQLDAIEKYRSGKEADLKAGLAELEADITKQGPGMEGAEARAKAREEKLTKREGDLVGASIFEAGMAIMAGESPYALTNIGRGAGIGMKSYTAGLEKLQEARDKLDESFDKIEQFRMNRADMNAREVRAAKKDIRATRSEADRLGLEALMKEGEMNRADARTGFQVLANNRAETYRVAANYDLGLQQIAAQRDIAGARNALYEKLHGGDLKAREEFGRIQRAVMQSLDKNPLYTNEPNENKKAIMFNTAMQQAMQNNPYLAPAAFGMGFSKTPPPGAKEVFDMTP
jgi:hypothetical protein